MIKKHKSLLIYLAFSIVFIAAIAVSAVYSYYNPSESEFLNANASSLLGKNLASGGTLYTTLEARGMLSCFYHKANAQNAINTTIHSVFDTGFDEEKGVMKVTSIINNGAQTSKTSYASSSNTSVGNLAAQAARSGNAYYVYTALRQAINAGTVVNESAINHNQEYWPGGMHNPAPADTVNLYNNYKKLSKTETSAETAEKGKEVTIKDKSYTIIGPFKMTFGGKDIVSITAGDATWESRTSTEIYWSDTISTTASDWSANFNQKSSGKYVLNNKRFYLAVETAKLPNSGTYRVTIRQDEFEYYNTRTIVCTGVQAQQIGMYCYSNSPKKVVGQATWNIKRNALKTLKILKVDAKTGEELTGAGFKIYAELTDGTKGWVSGSAEGDKTYGDTAAEYSAKVEIKNLKFGVYYIYETTIPSGYAMSDQDGYHQEAPGSSALTGDWVYLGKKTLNTNSSGDTITVKVTNKGFTSTEITKTDQISGEELTGAAFKLYAELKDGTKGWVSGSADGEKTYGATGTEYSAKEGIKNLKYGTYYVYETKAPEGYDLSEQDGYHKEAPGSNELSGDWVYLGYKLLDETYTNDTPFTVTIPNKPLGTMQIIKTDKTTGIELTGGKFKIYAVLKNGTSGWVSGEADGDKTYGSTASEYLAKTEIKNLKYGTYYIYETETPAGYDITKQDGYHQAAAGSDSLTGDWVYLGTQEIDINFPEDRIFKFSAENKKIVDKLEGYVWIDEPDTKDNVINHLYDDGGNDSLKQGITVNLYDGTGTLIATTTTDAAGHYEFTTKNAPSYTGEDKDIYYWDLAQAYVEFIYNNKTTYNEDGTVKEYGYIVVDPFVGNNVSINSKAQEYTITTEKLDDNNLTGTTGNNPGRAVTYRSEQPLSETELLANTENIAAKISNNTVSYDDLKETPLTGYYDNNTYRISNINLGLQEQQDPQFVIDENLAYIKVKMKGYTYTYKYGDAAVTNSTNVPTVNEQNSAKTFTGKIYPTDIAYNMAERTEELQVYVIYSIAVTNTETTYVDSKYVEERLYLDSLVNAYDTNRYVLCTNENNQDKSDFALWQDNGNGTASYDVNHENSVYKNGMEKQETKTSYIQFKIKEEALEKILTGGLTYEDIESAPTVATVTGYHEYLRTDNAWVHDESVRAFDGSKGAGSYPTANSSGKKYYVHKTISKSYSSSDLYLKLSLGDPRRVAGTVFEDIRTEESVSNNTNLGNGILDDNEANRAQQVTVELLNADRTTVTKLYKQENGQIVYNQDGSLPDARTTTEVGGTFTFEGVVPGYYYIRFTYGDGTQKMMPAGDAIQSNDYRSTIINTADNGSIIKNAMEASEEALESARQTLLADPSNENAKKLVEWYKYLDKNYSTAVDDTNQRLVIENYVYKEDGKVYDEAGNVVTNYPTNINSYTPMVGISIENDISDFTDNGNYHLANYDEFNFGMIKAADTILNIDKKITNLSYTSQTGSTLVSANPTDRTAAYVTALDNITGGSKYAKIEIDPSLIYGSELETTYELVITNNSVKDYIEEPESDEFGYYYKYGEMTGTARLKKIKVNEVIDELDIKYNYDSLAGEVTETITHEDGSTEESTVTIEKPAPLTSSETTNPDETTSTNDYLILRGWTEIESQAKTSIHYTATSLLSAEDEDTLYTNRARITSISLDKMTTLNSNFQWGDSVTDSTTLTITPTTGEDRSNTYWIAGAIALVVMAAGFVLLKKKVLK